MTHRFAHQAMATEFEIFCEHADQEYARQACWAAFDLLDRMERELSRFVENSDIARINGLAAGESARVNRWTMECLQMARAVYGETGGAFDISLGTGLQTLQLSPSDCTVRADTGAVRLDLGGIGKGYAVDRMAEVLVEWDIRRALLHGGGSSVRALDAPADAEGWPLTIGTEVVQARQRVFSASGLRQGEHIRDPRTGKPALRQSAWAAMDIRQAEGSSPAAFVEGFSTAFMILPYGEVEEICKRHPGLEAWLMETNQQLLRMTSCIPT